MNLLQHDIDELNERFPEAMSFIRGALLRKEAVELLYQQTHKTPLSPWQETRLNELLSLHACQQPLFLKIKENQKNTAMEKMKCEIREHIKKRGKGCFDMVPVIFIQGDHLGWRFDKKDVVPGYVGYYDNQKYTVLWVAGEES